MTYSRFQLQYQGPITNLPLDVLQLIFNYFVPANPIRIPGHCTLPILNLTRICSYWRQLAFETPELWDNIDLDLADPFNVDHSYKGFLNSPRKWFRCMTRRRKLVKSTVCIAVEWLRRARGRPRSLILSNTNIPYEYLQIWANAILDNIITRFPFRRLVLRLPSSHVPRLFWFPNEAFAHLQSLEISVRPPHLQEGPPPIFYPPTALPDLECLCLYGFWTPGCLQTGLEWNKVRYIALSSDKGLRCSTCLDILRQCSAVEHFKAVVWDDENSSTRQMDTLIILPTLITLELIFRSNHMEPLFRTLTMPNLERCSIDHSPVFLRHLSTMFGEMARRSSCMPRLRQLALYGISGEYHLDEVIPYVPSLVSLKIEGYGLAPMNDRVINDVGAGKLLPKLQRLDISVDSGKEADKILRLAMLRVQRCNDGDANVVECGEDVTDAYNSEDDVEEDDDGFDGYDMGEYNEDDRDYGHVEEVSLCKVILIVVREMTRQERVQLQQRSNILRNAGIPWQQRYTLSFFFYSEYSVTVTYMFCQSEASNSSAILSSSIKSTSQGPITNLPPHIVQLVFGYFVPVNPIRVPGKDARHILSLTQVCSCWRQIAFETPELWDNIELYLSIHNGPHSPHSIKRFLRSPLELYRHMRGKPVKSNLYIAAEWLRRAKDRPRSLTLSNAYGIPHSNLRTWASAILKDIVARFPFRHLVLYLPSSHLPMLLQLPDDALTHLQYLAVWGLPTSQPSSLPIFYPESQLPNLENLCLGGFCRTDYLETALAWEKVRCITLSCDKGLQCSTCLDILRQCSAIELFIASVRDDKVPSTREIGTPIVLPTLLTLQLSLWPNAVEPLFRTLTMPNLESCTIQHSLACPRHSSTMFGEMARRSSCMPRLRILMFYMVNGEYRPDEVIPYVSSLVFLKITGPGLAPINVRTICDMGAGKLLPKLRHLDISIDSAQEAEKVLKFAILRMKQCTNYGENVIENVVDAYNSVDDVDDDDDNVDDDDDDVDDDDDDMREYDVNDQDYTRVEDNTEVSLCKVILIAVREVTREGRARLRKLSTAPRKAGVRVVVTYYR
ncbi:hypothetical protein APHAL10511_000276 [Amanita phalloides]|nr:hypothetical protein APHAL10511_000276 [Amanita phalloides]